MLTLLFAPSLAGDLTDEQVLAEIAATDAWRSKRVCSHAPRPGPAGWAEGLEEGWAMGQVEVPGEDAWQTWGVMVIDAPIGAAWRAVNSDDRVNEVYAEHWNGTVELAEGLDFHDRRVYWQHFSLPWPISDRWGAVRIRANPEVFLASDGLVWEHCMESTPGAPYLATPGRQALAEKSVEMDFMRGGSWLVALSDGRTAFEIYSWFDMGGNLPAGLLSKLARSDLEMARDVYLELIEDASVQGSEAYVYPDELPLHLGRPAPAPAKPVVEEEQAPEAEGAAP